MLTSAECRTRAEQKIAGAELQPRHKRKLRGNAECWLVLADRMATLEASMGRSQGVAVAITLGDDSDVANLSRSGRVPARSNSRWRRGKRE
jgi:hypothetical protein